ncbi:MAG: AIR carboxylase family protein [Hymenobacter sp.]
MGSPADKEHCQKIRSVFRRLRRIHPAARDLGPQKRRGNWPAWPKSGTTAIEPGVIIAVAGLSNGLGGALAANVNVPVI